MQKPCVLQNSFRNSDLLEIVTEKDIQLFHKEGYVHTWEHQRMMYIKMVTVSDINRNRSGKWYGYGNSTCSAWLWRMYRRRKVKDVFHWLCSDKTPDIFYSHMRIVCQIKDKTTPPNILIRWYGYWFSTKEEGITQSSTSPPSTHVRISTMGSTSKPTDGFAP